MILKTFLKWLGVAAVAMLGACAQLPVRTTLPVEQRPSPNFNERRPNFVIIHHTSNDSAEPALLTLTSAAAEVSSHYLIRRDGGIVYLVDEMVRAWHAGDSYWGGNRDLNSSSIGIELDNNGDEPFAEPMMQSLLALLADIKARYRIPVANFLGHGDIAPGRKTDPSRYFSWKRLADAGFGVWCDPPYPPAPAGTDDILLLAAFGYDTARPQAARAAFRRRFLAEENSTQLNDGERGLLYCLNARKTE